jgi:hypothetical protein
MEGMEVLTDADKHRLHSTINSQVHAFKLRRSACESLTGKRALSDVIEHLHELKHKLGCWEGYSQQPKKGINEISDAG